MNKHAILLCMMPILAWANEPAVATKPIKAVDSHSAAPSMEAKAVSKHAAPMPMPASTSIKLNKPATVGAATAPSADGHATAASPATTEPPVVRYVPPKYTSLTRQTVRSQSPVHATSHHQAKKSSKSKIVASRSVSPGLVRVLPASQIPRGAILPPAKGLANRTMPFQGGQAAVWGSPDVEFNAPNARPVVAAEEKSPTIGRKMASPKFYTETNQELRWQYYSYP